jgi:hypothetical protein
MQLMLSRKENRRHPRVSYAGAVRISWQDERGLPHFAKAKCLDLSHEGLRIEITEPIPVLSRLSLRAEQINLGGSASVRHIASSGCKYILGLNLSQALENPPAELNFQ